VVSAAVVAGAGVVPVPPPQAVSDAARAKTARPTLNCLFMCCSLAQAGIWEPALSGMTHAGEEWFKAPPTDLNELFEPGGRLTGQ
jgi:hypothetical protein